jgi:hypothetical protein
MERPTAVLTSPTTKKRTKDPFIQTPFDFDTFIKITYYDFKYSFSVATPLKNLMKITLKTDEKKLKESIKTRILLAI